MKKNLLALTVAALAAATVASTASAATVYDKDGTSLAVYGRVQSVFYSDKANGTSADGDSATVNTSGRFGVKVRQQFNQQFAGFAMAEWDVADGTTDNFRGRELSVGVDMGQFGKVKFGRFEEAIKYALFATDIYDDWGCYGYQGNDDRRDGMVQYQWSGYGFDALVSYGFSKSGAQVDGAFNGTKNGDNIVVSERHNLDSSVSLAAGYTSPDVVFGPIQVRAGVAFGSFTEGFGSIRPAGKTVDGLLDSYTSFALGASWGKLNIGPYVGVQFSQRTFDLYNVTAGNPDDFKVMGIEAAVGYSFANGVTFRTGIDYIQNEMIVDSKVKDIEGAVLPAYLNWQISPNFNVWGEARFDLGSASDKNGNASYVALTGKNLDENVYSFGIRYTF